MNGYPLGATLTFLDSTATVSDDATGVATGLVNGEPLFDNDGRLEAVPVWAERDKGREPTTVYVVASNILKVGARES